VPKIQWTNLPEALRDHLFDPLRERKIDFGSFKLCGDGQYPKTFLLAGQVARGERLDT
jgi:hypothetical protein